MKKKSKVVILGGGPSGLFCGWELAEKGYEVILIEKENRCGGLCVTNEHNGFRFDLGGHRFISPEMYIIERIKSILKDELLLQERKSVIRLKGKEFKYPINLTDALFKLEAGNALGIVKDAFHKVFNGHRGASDSLEQWFINSFGQTLYSVIFEPYNEKLWGVHPGSMSSEWARQRISALNIKTIISKLLNMRKEKERTYSRQYLYPKEGIGAIFTAMAKNIKDKGGEILSDSVPLGLSLTDNLVRGVHLSCGGKTRFEECGYLVSTIPLHDLVKLFPALQAGSDINKWLDNLKYRSLRFMNIMINKERISENTWQYVPERECIFTRIQEPKARSPYMAPPGKTSLMLEIPCDKGDNICKMEDAALFKRVLKDLRRTGIVVKDEDVLGYFSTSAGNAYPVYSLDYKQYRDKVINSLLDNSGNLVICGRQGSFSYLFMDFAMSAGKKAAEYIDDPSGLSRFDIANVMNYSGLIETKSLTDNMSI
ncbi:MAG: FAD-dependent oxidoreductase [Candidatus Omnitrophica bacterium]|nr:FAD-dependent oxidoreductase [Candidatus Omnitrophota bacterium]